MNKRSILGIVSSLIVTGLLFLPITGSSQNKDQPNKKPIIDQPATSSQTISIQEMMQYMQQMMGKTNGMMQMMHMNQNMGMAANQQQMTPESQNMMNMMHGLDGTIKNMNQMLEQMNSMMQNPIFIENPQMKKDLEHMKQQMGMMMNSMDLMVKDYENLQQMTSDQLDKSMGKK